MHKICLINKLYVIGGEKMQISKVLKENIEYVEKTYEDCGDVIKRKFAIGKNKDIWVYTLYVDNMSEANDVQFTIIRPLINDNRLTISDTSSIGKDIFQILKNNNIMSPDIREAADFDDIHVSIMSGDTALFVDGSDNVLIVATRGWPNRGVQNTDTEIVVQGSKEAFSEVFRINTVLIRRRIRDTNLKVKQLRTGKRSQTDLAIVYLEDVVRQDVLNNLLEKIDNIDIDAILDVGYIEQYIERDYLSPFPQGQVTERPDKAASAILEGRIVVVVDNTPFVLIVPSTLNCFFQSSEDYYQRFEIMSFTRIIRYIASVVAITLPGLYLAVALYNPSMIPPEIMFKIAESRQNIPFPAVVEIVVMDIAFELLREAGIRLPLAIGSTIGVVGGIIIGQAAVEAGLVSPITVIIIALTGVCGFAIPNVSLVSGIRLSKYLIIFTSAILGLFGFWIGILILLIHLASLKSFGFPYLLPFVSSDLNGYADLKDSIIRMPLFTMKKRPIFSNPNQNTRSKKGVIPNDMV